MNMKEIFTYPLTKWRPRHPLPDTAKNEEENWKLHEI